MLKDDIAYRIRGTALFVPARVAYRAMFAGKLAAQRQTRMRAFYSKFVRPSETVFDIGANIGEYTDVFASLGATVIAVEPNPACVRKLRTVVRRRPGVRLEEAAVGEVPGSAQLYVCSESLYSSMNAEWVHNSRSVKGYERVGWTAIHVQVLTLDALAAQFGVPTFIKIDVEGYEREVLRGMSFTPRYVSFEWNAPMPHVAAECIHFLGSRGFVFNCIHGRDLEFLHPRWLTAPEAERWLSTYVGTAEYGDMFARRM